MVQVADQAVFFFVDPLIRLLEVNSGAVWHISRSLVFEEGLSFCLCGNEPGLIMGFTAVFFEEVIGGIEGDYNAAMVVSVMTHISRLSLVSENETMPIS